MRLFRIAAVAIVLLSSLAIYPQQVPPVDVKAEKISETISDKKWTKVPAGFGGVKWGSTEEQLATTVGALKCKDRSKNGRMRECVTAKREDGIVVSPTLSAQYILIDGKLAAVELINIPKGLFGSVRTPFDDVVRHFTSEYGEPNKDSTYRYKGSRRETRYTGKKPSLYETKVTYVDYKQRCLAWNAPNASAQICGRDGASESGPYSFIHSDRMLKYLKETTAEPAK